MPLPFETHGVIGAVPPRIEGLGKVTGQAPYGADHSVPGDALHAALVLAPIARGRVAFIDDPGAEEADPYSPLGEVELSAGDLAAGFAAAAATVDAAYKTPAQHHNPMELFQTICAWDADRARLTVWESSQNVHGVQHGLTLQLGIAPDAIRVVSPVVGGGFGAQGRMGHNTALVALAARRLGRPVKHIATRREGFTLRHFRAETRHRLRLGADAQGRLLALDHRSWELTSRDDRFVTAGPDATARLYACPNSAPSYATRRRTGKRRASCAGRPKRRTCSPWNPRWTSRRTRWTSTPWSCGDATRRQPVPSPASPTPAAPCCAA